MPKHNFIPKISKKPSKVDTSFIESSLPNNKIYIIANKTSFFTKNQIESCKQIINKTLSKSYTRYVTTVEYNLVRTKKSIGTRMGKGKGKVSDKVAFIKKHNSLFEFQKVDSVLIKIILLKIRYKLPISLSWK